MSHLRVFYMDIKEYKGGLHVSCLMQSAFFQGFGGGVALKLPTLLKRATERAALRCLTS